jgi:hypothetical protein
VPDSRQNGTRPNIPSQVFLQVETAVVHASHTCGQQYPASGLLLLLLSQGHADTGGVLPVCMQMVNNRCRVPGLCGQ